MRDWRFYERSRDLNVQVPFLSPTQCPLYVNTGESPSTSNGPVPRAKKCQCDHHKLPSLVLRRSEEARHISVLFW